MPGNFDPLTGSLDTSYSQLGSRDTLWVYVTPALEGVVHDSAQLVTSVIPELSVHNFPNPFEGETRIVWSQPEDGQITLRLADRAGRAVATVYEATCGAGIHTHLWQAETSSGEELAPGVYVLILDYKPSEAPPGRIVTKVLCTQGRRQ